jgi:hypothetical protein
MERGTFTGGRQLNAWSVRRQEDRAIARNTVKAVVSQIGVF